MQGGNPHDLVAFEQVRILNVAAGALRCLIGDKRVWLAREHIKSTLCCRGDRGRLFVRRWVALDRQLDLPGAARVVPPSLPPHRAMQQRRLRLVPLVLLTSGA